MFLVLNCLYFIIFVFKYAFTNNEKKNKLNGIESSFDGIGYVMPNQEDAVSIVLITGNLCVFENSNAL
jgi:hypothetical protein